MKTAAHKQKFDHLFGIKKTQKNLTDVRFVLYLCIFSYLAAFLRNETAAKIKNTKNNILAIPAEVPAMPPNPNTAAINAITKKVSAQLNIIKPRLFV